MPIRKGITVYAHKGGTGKTTTAFQLATALAKKKEDEGDRVLLIDVSFQADASGTVLTQKPNRSGRGGKNGEAVAANYAAMDESIEEDAFIDISINPPGKHKVPKTIGGYMTGVHQCSLSRACRRPLGTEFVIKAHEHNTNVTANLELVIGDTQLEHLMPHIDAKRNEFGGDTTPWRDVTEWLKEMIDEITTSGYWWVIIDTDPAFNLYTQMAVTAAPHVLLVLTPDDYSRKGMNATLELLFGKESANHLYNTYIQHSSYHVNSKQYDDMQRPKIHLLLCNRLTQYEQANQQKTSEAFDQLCTKAETDLFEFYKSNPEYFTHTDVSHTDRIGQFKEAFTHRLHDMHRVSLASAHMGTPVSDDMPKTLVLNRASKRIRIDRNQVHQYAEQIDALVDKLVLGSFNAPSPAGGGEAGPSSEPVSPGANDGPAVPPETPGGVAAAQI